MPLASDKIIDDVPKSESSTIHTLRPYQQECIDASLSALKRGVRKQAVSLPVGSGKTLIFSNLMTQIPKWSEAATKVLVLAHREELISQAKKQIERANPNLYVDIDMGKNVALMAADVIVASVPTLGRKDSNRLARYDPNLFKLIIIDEAHHAAAATYRRIIDYFISPFKKNHDSSDETTNEESQPSQKPVDSTSDENCDNLGPVVWGCSATLSRHDGLSLERMFDEIIYQKGFIEMIKEKWLCEITATTIKTQVSLDGVKTKGDDFETSSLSSRINTPERNNLIVQKYLDLVILQDKKNFENNDHVRKSTVAFAVNVDHVLKLEMAFKKCGVDARHILGTTNNIDRTVILSDFKKGNFPVLINCDILTEGTDVPNIDCILMARPTKSHTLFQQMLGRGVRLHPDKKDCLVVDFVDSFKKKSGLVNIPTLLGLDPESVLSDKNVVGVLNGKPRTSDENSDFDDDFEIPYENLEELEKLEHITRKLNDPYAIFKVDVDDFSRLGNFFNPMLKDTFSGTKSLFGLDVVTCGDYRLPRWSSLSWVAISNRKYVLQTREFTVFLERNEEQMNDNTEKNKSKFSAYYRRIIQTNSGGGGGSKSGGRFLAAKTIIPMTADNISLAFKACDLFVKSKIPYHEYTSLSRFQKWRLGEPTDKQIKYLSTLGIPKELLQSFSGKNNSNTSIQNQPSTPDKSSYSKYNHRKTNTKNTDSNIPSQEKLESTDLSSNDTLTDAIKVDDLAKEMSFMFIQDSKTKKKERNNMKLENFYKKHNIPTTSTNHQPTINPKMDPTTNPGSNRIGLTKGAELVHKFWN
ncbi:hypothetical protein BB559_005616 [Furculomyces boomerangus]|uniref:Uncharacterized protein n=1 Tax=Furculomyces boomerangus TaxID=61424 RepID=A0A2T9Y7L5_9FUNG|nr:hypothetical protein BB559_005616 [Furculomyces boomerangus]